MPDELDRRLHVHGERWRAALPPLPDLDTAATRRARSHRWYVAGIAAAVVLVAGGISAGVAVLGHGGQPSLPPSAPTVSTRASASATSSAPARGVVPWAALPATNPMLPRHTIPASPDPAAAAGVRRCISGDLKPVRNGVAGAAGTAFISVRLDLVGPSPCQIQGVPTVRPFSRGRAAEIPVRAETGIGNPFGPIRPVVVTSTGPASFEIARGEASCPTYDNDQLQVTLPDSTSPFDVAGFGPSACTPDDPGTAPISVGAVEPLHQRSARVISPYDHVAATGADRLSGRAGQPLDFTVTLTSRQDLPLDPCPDYTISLSSDRMVRQRYALDCSAVPHRDSQGRPYLPAGVPVAFAMRAAPPPAGASKLLWQLDTPGTDPASTGTLVNTDR